MSKTDLTALTPLIILAATPLVMMVAIAIRRQHTVVSLIALAGLALSLIAALTGYGAPPRMLGDLLVIDPFARFYTALLCAAGFSVALISHGYLEKLPDNREEYYLLLLTATLGATVLVASRHFVSLFLGLEVLSVSLYGLIAYRRSAEMSVEAGLKYLILAALSSAFLLFGMALVYADTGALAFPALARTLGNATPLSLIGLALLVVGIGFKLAVVPFHLWTPDVYQGAPAPVTAFVATVSKGGMFAVLLRFFAETDGYQLPGLVLIFAIIAVASMLIGNLLALRQDNLKRVLAYSSIAHLGYLLVAFLAGGAMGIEAATYYLVAYFITTIGAFGIIAILSDTSQEAEHIADYRGLFWERPWLAAVFTTFLLSLAGIPLTAGFVGKFYLLAAGVSRTLWLPVIVLVISSVIGLYYYLRIVVAMYSAPVADTAPAPPLPVGLSLGGSAVVALMGLLLLWLGVYPAPLIRAIQTMF